MSDNEKPSSIPPSRPNTEETFKRIQESGGSKSQPGNGEGDK